MKCKTKTCNEDSEDFKYCAKCRAKALESAHASNAGITRTHKCGTVGCDTIIPLVNTYCKPCRKLRDLAGKKVTNKARYDAVCQLARDAKKAKRDAGEAAPLESAIDYHNGRVAAREALNPVLLALRMCQGGISVVGV